MTRAFHIENFGCRAARADGEALAGHLQAAGMETASEAPADLVIVNTCSVTAEADRSARAFIRRTHRQNPDARIVVTGCYAQRAPDELANLQGVAAVVGNSHKALAPQIALGMLTPATSEPSFVPVTSLLGHPNGHAPIWADDRFAHSFLEEAQLIPGEQTRPNLKIQEGCGNRCTFCVIPQTRGHSRSLTEDRILQQVRTFVDAGGRELVLSGINLGRWGRDLPYQTGSKRPSLAGLVHRILMETNLPLLRLSSIEPMDWDSELIALLRDFAGDRMARHAHLPLQSGSDSVLRRMHRRYRPWHYLEKIHALLEAAGPGLTLGADVMAGFPGETDAEFQETCDLIGHIPFGYLHLFPFSSRPGTRGAQLHAEAPVPASVLQERMTVLRRLAAEKTAAHRAKFLGSSLRVLTLNTPVALAERNRTAALSDNFLPIQIEGRLASNEFITVCLDESTDDQSLFGIVVSKS